MIGLIMSDHSMIMHDHDGSLMALCDLSFMITA